MVEDMTSEPPKRRGRRPRKVEEARAEITEKKEAKTAKEIDAISIQDMPLETREDYHAYNAAARKLRLPTKMIPHHLFPNRKIKFTRIDKKNVSTPIKLISGEHYIDFQKSLQHGQIYELPEPVIEFLHSRTEPRFKEMKYPDGSAEMVHDYDEPRFSCQMVV